MCGDGHCQGNVIGNRAFADELGRTVGGACAAGAGQHLSARPPAHFEVWGLRPHPRPCGRLCRPGAGRRRDTHPGQRRPAGPVKAGPAGKVMRVGRGPYSRSIAVRVTIHCFPYFLDIDPLNEPPIGDRLAQGALVQPPRGRWHRQRRAGCQRGGDQLAVGPELRRHPGPIRHSRRCRIRRDLHGPAGTGRACPGGQPVRGRAGRGGHLIGLGGGPPQRETNRRKSGSRGDSFYFVEHRKTSLMEEKITGPPGAGGDRPGGPGRS